MRFLIKSHEVGTDRVFHHIYNNITNEVFDDEGNLVDFSALHPTGNLVLPFASAVDKSRFYPKKENLKKLKIQVGLKCNFHCAYCHERANNKTIPIQPDLIGLVPKFLSRLAATIKTVKDIVLIGGEPFVYIKIMRPLVKGLRGLYPDARLHIITNGSLLNKEIADWCIDNGINLTVSHDGPPFSKYRNEKDILDNPKVVSAIQHYFDRNERERKGLEIGLNVVVYPENCDLVNLPEFFNKKIGRDLKIAFESIVKLNEETVDKIAMFDNEKIGALFSAMFELGVGDKSKKQNETFRGQCFSIARAIATKRDLNGFQFSCNNAREDNMFLDLSGHLLACHGSPYTQTGYGEIEEFATATSDIMTKWSNRPRCPECPFLVSCLGGCPLQSEKSHEIECGNLRIWHMGIFLVAWQMLFKAIIVEISPLREG